MMQEKMEIAKRILFEFEQKYDPFKFGQDSLNFSTWVLVREKLFKYIKKEAFSEKNNQTYKDKQFSASKINTLIKRMIDYNRKKKLINKGVDLLFISNSYFRRGARSENIFIDGILKNLDKDINFLILEIPTLTDFDKKYVSSNFNDKVIPLDFYLPKGSLFLLYYDYKYKKRVTNEIEHIFSEYKVSTIKYGDIEIKEKDLIDFIKPIWIKETIKFMAWKEAFKPLYKKMRPRKVVDIANAGRFAKSIYNDKADFYEIQHGIIHPYHLAYVYPKIQSVEKGILKNKKMILYGSYYCKLLSEKSYFDKKDLHVIGNPSYSGFKELKPIEYNEFKKKLAIEKDKKIILFTSQYEPQIQLILYNFIKELSELVDSDYLIVVKLHPRETVDSIYEDLRDLENICFTTSTPSLHDLLSYSYVHLSVSSTVLLEATLFGIPNIIIKSEYSGYVGEILEKSAMIIENPKELIDLLESEYLSKIDRCELTKKSADLFGDSKNIYLDIANLLSGDLKKL